MNDCILGDELNCSGMGEYPHISVYSIVKESHPLNQPKFATGIGIDNNELSVPDSLSCPSTEIQRLLEDHSSSYPSPAMPRAPEEVSSRSNKRKACRDQDVEKFLGAMRDLGNNKFKFV